MVEHVEPGLGRALGAGDAHGDRRHVLAVVAAIQVVPSTVSSAMIAEVSALSPVLGGLGKRPDEARDIGRARGRDRADRGEPLFIGRPQRKAERREQLAELSCVAASASSLYSATTPRRTSTGKLGMARTILPAPGKRSRRVFASTPASSDTIIVCADSRWRSCGAISSSCCGLNASTTNFGGGPASAKLATTRTPSTGLPLGRMTVTGARSMVAARQPLEDGAAHIAAADEPGRHRQSW